jgi:predicted ATPase/DNA-binding CsgD family transcriptional regulator
MMLLLMVGRAAGPSAGNLTAAVTSFVGRRREIAQVRDFLAISRLVTLIGVGGVGKTRLAVEVGREASRAFADGVWLVDLATVTDPSLVAQAVATTLGVRDQSTRAALDQLTDHLADRRLLILLDNCEHLLDGCATVVDRLLRRCPELRVLATSRRTLGIGGEHVVTVPPLSLPDAGQPVPVAALAQYDAITLLVERAAAVVPAFEVTERNQDAVVRLCGGLDGIPLAIELAATRLHALSVEQVVARLTDRFGLLTGGSRVALPRQRTLRALIDWSYDLCSDNEKRLWARLSVFAGGFDLDAAEGVCAGDGLRPELILDLVHNLVAQSILVTGTSHGRPGFRMLESIRQYGHDRLAEFGEHDRLRQRHRDYFVGVAIGIAERWCGPRQGAELARMRADHSNLRLAFDWCLAEPDGWQPALSLCSALCWHWCADGYLSEGRRWLEQALALPTKPGPELTMALWVVAWIALLQGDHDIARERLAECGALAEQTGDRQAAAYATSLTGTADLFQGDVPTAIDNFTRAVTALDELDDQAGVLLTLFQLSITHSHAGDHDSADRTAQRAIRISQQADEHWGRSYTLWVRGFDRWRRGELTEAGDLVLAALTEQAEFRDAVGAALMTELLAWISSSRNDHTRAACLLGTARSIWRSIGTGIGAFGPQLAQHHDRCERVARGELGESAFRAAFEQGARPTVEEAVAYAMRRREQHTATPQRPVLTRREQEVAELVAEGLSNRNIAQRLVVSQRTVDGHVEHILAKLGFASRAQVAAWVVAHKPH